MLVTLVQRGMELGVAGCTRDGDSRCSARLGTRLLVALGIKTLKKILFFSNKIFKKQNVF